QPSQVHILSPAKPRPPRPRNACSQPTWLGCLWLPRNFDEPTPPACQHSHWLAGPTPPTSAFDTG
ncbi:MAG: hypothetical protein ACKOJF_30660, partial [Planctomycetaceae bacterium]